MRKALSIVGAVVVAALICVSLIFLGWGDTWLGNQVEYVDQKIDDATNYETRKTVEDSCRAMIASYEADKLTYEQYKDSENAGQPYCRELQQLHSQELLCLERKHSGRYFGRASGHRVKKNRRI